MPLPSESIVRDVWSSLRSARILLSNLNHVSRVINMSLNLSKLPDNSVIRLIQDADIPFDSVDPTHCRVKHVTIVNKLPPNDGLNLFRTRRKIGKLSPDSLYSLLEPLSILVERSNPSVHSPNVLEDGTVIPSLAIDPASEILNPPVILLNCCAPIRRVMRVPRPIGKDEIPCRPAIRA